MKSSNMSEGRNASKKVGNHCAWLNTYNHLLFYVLSFIQLFAWKTATVTSSLKIDICL